MTTKRGGSMQTVCSRHGEQIVDHVERDVVTLMCDCMFLFEFPGTGEPVEQNPRSLDDGEPYRPVPASRLS